MLIWSWNRDFQVPLIWCFGTIFCSGDLVNDSWWFLIFESVSIINQIIESLELKRTSKIIDSNRIPIIAYSTIFLHAASTHLINVFRNGDTTTILCSLCLVLTTLSVKKFFAIPNLNCFGIAWGAIISSDHLLPGRRDWSPAGYTLLLGSCREWQGLP